MFGLSRLTARLAASSTASPLVEGAETAGLSAEEIVRASGVAEARSSENPVAPARPGDAEFVAVSSGPYRADEDGNGEPECDRVTYSTMTNAIIARPINNRLWGRARSELVAPGRFGCCPNGIRCI